MAFTDLPPELTYQIALDLYHARERLNLARTCSKLRDPAISALYSNLEFNCRSGSNFKPKGAPHFDLFVRKLLQDPSSGVYAQHFSLDQRFDVSAIVEGGNFEDIDDIIKYAVECMPNLKDLSIEHAVRPYLFSGGPQMLETLWLGDQIDGDGGVHIDMLQPMLALPRIKDVAIMAARLNEDSLLAMLQEAEPKVSFSTVESLTIWVGNISLTILRYLLEAPIILKEFFFGPYSYSGLEQGLWGLLSGYTHELPSISTIVSLLERHKDTVITLEIDRGLGYWDTSLNITNSLRSWSKLQDLSISLDVLLGWNHCEHHRGWATTSIPRPAKFASLLPATLKKLSLSLEDHHHMRNGRDYLYTALKSIVNDKLRLNELQRISICLRPAKRAKYCAQCDAISEELDGNGHEKFGISSQERDMINEMTLGIVDIYFGKSLFFDLYRKNDEWLDEEMTAALQTLFVEQE